MIVYSLIDNLLNYLKLRKSNLKFLDLLDPNLDEKCIWLLAPVSFHEILIKTCSAVKYFWKGLNEHKSCSVVNWGFFSHIFPRFSSLKSSKQFEIRLQWRLYEICPSRKCAILGSHKSSSYFSKEKDLTF